MTYDEFLTNLCVWREARGSGPEAQLAVRWVIENRVKSGKFGRGHIGVILRPLQFSSFNPKDPNAALLPNPLLPRDWEVWEDICEMSVGVSDPTLGATHYHSFTNPADFPKWADGARQTTQIGPFRFYRL